MITAKMELVTPEIAAEMLTHNTNNYRSASEQTVARYALDMKSGRWKENGEPIQFSEDGTLLNGQHRLKAIVKSSATIPMLVVRGIENGMAYFDFGSNRSAFQIATACGYDDRYKNQIIAICSLLISRSANNVAISKTAIMEYYAAHREKLVAVTTAGASTSGALRITGVLTGAYVKYCHGMPLYKLQQFFTIGNSGYPIDGVESTPPLCLRNNILDSKGIGSSAKRREILSCTLQAMDDFSIGKHRTKRYTPSEKSLDEFYQFLREEGLQK